MNKRSSLKSFSYLIYSPYMNHFYKIISSLFLYAFLIACDSTDNQKSDHSYNWANHNPFTTSYQVFGMPFTEDYQTLPEEKGTVNMSEASGLAYSVKNENMIWSHNDSGNANVVYLLDARTGTMMARYTLMGTANHDWEDMEITIDAETKEPYIYVADIGDNNERRQNYRIYKFKEPEYKPEHYGQNIQLTPEDFSKIEVMYPDGSHDAESLLVDPKTKDIFVVTKRDVLSTLYVIPFPYKTDGTVNTMYKVGTFSFREASAGTVSLDGTKIMIKNRQDIFYWKHSPDESIWKTLSQTPEKAPYIGEPQGEAIAFDWENNYFTLSEELNSSTRPILYKYIYKKN